MAGETVKFILTLLSRYRRLAVLVVGAGLLNGVASTALLMFLNEGLGQPQDRLGEVALSFFGLCAVVFLTNMTTDLLLLRMAQRVTLELRLELSRKIVAAPFPILEKLGSSRVFVNLAGDVGTLTSMITTVPTAGVSAMVVLLCLIYLGWLSWQMLLMTIVFIGAGVLFYQYLSDKARGIIRDSREQADTLYQRFRDITEGAKELKMHRRRREIIIDSDLQSVATRLRDLNLASGFYFVLAKNVGMILFFLGVGSLVFVAPQFYAVDADILRGYALVILYLIGPLQQILSVYPNLLLSRVALEKIEVLGSSLGTTESTDSSAIQPVAAVSHIGLRDVEWHYSDQPEKRDTGFKLGPITLDLFPGELVFLAGGNGSGKSTLAKILVGLYSATGGSITVNQRPLSPDALDEFRQNFSVIFSDYYLFDNLKGVVPAEHWGRLDSLCGDYLQKLKLEHKVQVADGVFSTIKLSSGQRKRLALLVAYLEDRPVYVFDEWAADQDPAFREFFYQTLLPELKARNKIVLVISHDDRYYHLADRLLLLDYGQLREIESSAFAQAGGVVCAE